MNFYWLGELCKTIIEATPGVLGQLTPNHRIKRCGEQGRFDPIRHFYLFANVLSLTGLQVWSQERRGNKANYPLWIGQTSMCHECVKGIMIWFNETDSLRPLAPVPCCASVCALIWSQIESVHLYSLIYNTC